jgi:hypothetical protein
MTIEIIVDEKDLKGFSPPACELLKESAEKYIAALIREANRIEAGRNSTSGPPEITKPMVHSAVVAQENGLGQPKRSMFSKFVNVAAAVLSMVVGFMYDAETLKDQTHLLIFIGVIALTVITITISVFRD